VAPPAARVCEYQRDSSIVMNREPTEDDIHEFLSENPPFQENYQLSKISGVIDSNSQSSVSRMDTGVNPCRDVRQMTFPISVKEREPAVPASLNSIIRTIDGLKRQWPSILKLSVFHARLRVPSSFTELSLTASV
jgi:hypothetical protein